MIGPSPALWLSGPCTPGHGLWHACHAVREFPGSLFLSPTSPWHSYCPPRRPERGGSAGTSYTPGGSLGAFVLVQGGDAQDSQSPCHSRLLAGPTALLSPASPRAKHPPPPVSYSEPLPPPSASESLHFYPKRVRYCHYKKRLPPREEIREWRFLRAVFRGLSEHDWAAEARVEAACDAPSRGLGNV